MIKFWVTNLILLFTCTTANACLWEKSDPAYWPSTTIPVCFTNETNDPHIQNIIRIVRNSYTELNRKTNFTFQGFNSCSQISSTQAAIRIKLGGASVGEAYSIGPGSAHSPINMDLPTNSSDSQNNLIPIDETFLTWTAMHETMHLLGFHHDAPVDSNSMRKSASGNPNLMVNGDYDSRSIMTHESRSLSDSDIRCINLVAQRSFVGNREILPLEQKNTSTAQPRIEVIHSTPAVSK